MDVTTPRDTPPPTGQDRRLGQLLLALGVVIALGIAVAVTWAITSDNGGRPSQGASPTATQAPTGGPTSEPAPTASSPVSPSASGVPAPAFGYQPLWPFPTMAAATVWQQAYRTSGVQPWHLDPGLGLGDCFGRKRIFLVGIVVFTTASLGCGLAPGVTALIAARVVQGVGGALMIPGALAMVSTFFGPAERGRAIGTWSAFSVLATAIGPVLGGLLARVGLWRWVFFINLPLAAWSFWRCYCVKIPR